MTDPIPYDPDSVQKLVVRLNRRAIFVLLFWPLIGILIGGFAGREFSGNLAAVIGAVVGGYFGYLFGSARSIYYKIQVQTMLWQKRIEELIRTR